MFVCPLDTARWKLFHPSYRGASNSVAARTERDGNRENIVEKAGKIEGEKEIEGAQIHSA